MSKSIHTTHKDVKGLTKKEIEEQYNDPESDLAKLGNKSFVKSEMKKLRKNEKITEELKKKNGL
jgi:hypothetical protein